MTDDTAQPRSDEPAAPTIQAKSRFSIVWLIPLVAALIGGYLAWKVWSEQGPTITITFKTADGLAAGKTKIKFKDVDVGQVTGIDIAENLEHVVVTADLDKGTEPFMKDKTHFWVVRARVAAGQVSGIGTIFSGAYIGMDPVTEGSPTKSFAGLDAPPSVTTGQKGQRFLLRADDLGSLDIGSPVYYRKIKVGEVAAYSLSDDGKHVNLEIFVNTPHHQKVSSKAKFWNASGLDVRVTAQGITIDSQSMITVMLGGIAFEDAPDGEPVDEHHVFELYESRSATKQKIYVEKEPAMLFFTDSVRGLVPGSSLDFQGIQIGEVKDVRLEYDLDTAEFRIPVLLEIEPERFVRTGGDEMPAKDRLGELIGRGLRAQLHTANLITGQLRIELDFHPDAPAAELVYSQGLPVIPTIPAPLAEITGSLTDILQKVQKLPIEEIGNDLRDTVHSAKQIMGSDLLLEAARALRDTVLQVEQLAGTLNGKVPAALDQTVAQLQKTLQSANVAVRQARTTLASTDKTVVQADETLSSVQNAIGVDSPLYTELIRLVRDLQETARSIRTLSSYLERHPDALLRGKRR